MRSTATHITNENNAE